MLAGSFFVCLFCFVEGGGGMSGHFVYVCVSILCACTSFCFAVANWSSRGSVCICGQDG